MRTQHEGDEDIDRNLLIPVIDPYATDQDVVLLADGGIMSLGCHTFSHNNIFGAIFEDAARWAPAGVSKKLKDATEEDSL